MTARTRIIKRGQGHSYELDGAPAPGVTSIIGSGVPKPWLAPWTARQIAEFVFEHLTPVNGHVYADELLDGLREFNAQSRYPKRLPDEFSRLAYADVLKAVQYGVRDAAADAGTAVHGYAELLARGETIDVPDELVGHVDSYLQFLEQWQPTDAILERVVINRAHRYMGKLDMIATFPDRGVGLVDIKTGKSVYADTALQLAAYRHAETMLAEHDDTEEPMPQVDWCGVIWVRADGYDVYEYRADQYVFQQFLYCKQVAEFFADNGPVSRLKSDALPAPSEESVA